MQMQIKIQQSTARFFLYQIASTHQLQASSSFTFGKDLIKHNLVVFRSGEGALQVSKLLNPFIWGKRTAQNRRGCLLQILPPLVDVIPEARLNLVGNPLKKPHFVTKNDATNNGCSPAGDLLSAARRCERGVHFDQGKKLFFSTLS